MRYLPSGSSCSDLTSERRGLAEPGGPPGGTASPGGGVISGHPRATVGADLGDEHLEHMKSRGVDPADYIGADDLARLLGDEFTVERHAIEPRIDPPPGTAHIADVVLRARRR